MRPLPRLYSTILVALLQYCSGYKRDLQGQMRASWVSESRVLGQRLGTTRRSLRKRLHPQAGASACPSPHTVTNIVTAFSDTRYL